MSNVVKDLDRPSGNLLKSSRYLSVVALILVYIFMQILLYVALYLFLRFPTEKPTAYLDWVYYFYYPEKKLKFFYFLLFLSSTWIFCFIVDVRLNLWRKRDNEFYEN